LNRNTLTQKRHCEERSDAAIQSHTGKPVIEASGLLRFARNDEEEL